MELLEVNSHYIILVKPLGLDSEHQVPELLTRQLGGSVFPIHRLDKNVSGVMVYARTKAAAAQLSRAVQEGLLIKEYRAMVHGTPPETGDWTDFLFKDSRKNKVFVVKSQRKGVKEARLEFCRLTDSDPSLVHIRLHTGRSHQIRVQFASRGYPLVGDHKYGARDGCPEPRLFSCRLQFPWDGEVRSYQALPDWSPGELFPIH